MAGRPTGLAKVEARLPLEELVRRSARDVIQWAIEMKFHVLLDALSAVSLLHGRLAVVRNSH